MNNQLEFRSIFKHFSAQLYFMDLRLLSNQIFFRLSFIHVYRKVNDTVSITVLVVVPLNVIVASEQAIRHVVGVCIFSERHKLPISLEVIYKKETTRFASPIDDANSNNSIPDVDSWNLMEKIPLLEKNWKLRKYFSKYYKNKFIYE